MIEDKDFDKMLDDKLKEKKKKQEAEIEIKDDISKSSDLPGGEIITVEDDKSNYPAQPSSEDGKIYEENSIIRAWAANNASAYEIARTKYEDINKQKRIGKKIEKVATRKTNADIESANTAVEEQEKDIKVKKQQIKNELLKLKNDKVFLTREQKHRLKMQNFQHRKEKYGDLMMKYCRRKQKDEHGKMVYLKDEKGNYLLNYPNAFTLFWLILFDTIVNTLNQVSEVCSSVNKVVVKGFFIILICLIIFVEPIRQWIFGLIGMKF